MKTEVIMKRELFGIHVEQQSKSGYFNATSLVAAGNVWRRENNKDKFNITAYYGTKSTKEFIEELEKHTGLPAKKRKSSRKDTQWVHPLLFIDIALSISPKLKVETYQWLSDNLLTNRNDSGESYKRMTGALYKIAKDKRNFSKNMAQVALVIKKKVGVENWELATAQELRLRDKIHDNISLITDLTRDGNTAIKVGILKGFEQMGLDNPFIPVLEG